MEKDFCAEWAAQYLLLSITFTPGDKAVSQNVGNRYYSFIYMNIKHLTLQFISDF